MKTFYLLKGCLLLSLILGSCSKDSGDDGNKNITLSLDEYPSSGTTIASLQSSLDGTVLYAVTFESVKNAFAIDSRSGLLTTGDPFAYDFESDAIVTGRVTASNGTDVQTFEITINVNDIDDIEYVLSQSKSDYQSASVGDWIEITVEEYDNLAFTLTEVAYTGSEDQTYATIINASRGYEYHSNVTLCNEKAPIPENNYLFAFRYVSGSTEVGNAKVKISPSSRASGFQDIGIVLPQHGADEVFFVLKGNDLQYTEESYLGMYSENSIAVDIEHLGLGQHYFRTGDVSLIGDTNGITVSTHLSIYQGLSTPIKQWN